jgi:hypothetical protein
MAKEATKTALAKSPDAGEFQKLMESIPRYTEIKNLDRPAVEDMAAKDWFHETVTALNVLAGSLTAAASFVELIHKSAPYVRKIRDLMKINRKMAANDPNRKTWKSVGIVIEPGTTINTNGTEVEVKEDDPIGWTSCCAVIFKKTPQEVNRAISGVQRSLPAYAADEEPNPNPGGGEYKVTKQPIAAEEDEDEDETPVEPAPSFRPKAMMPVPVLKQGDVDALIKFLQADSVVGDLPPMDAVFSGLSDFDLSKKAESLARKIVEEYGTDKATFNVKVTMKKKPKVDEPIDEEEPPFLPDKFTAANEQL